MSEETTHYHVVNIGSAPNSKDGDTARVAFKKVNDNFDVLFSVFANQLTQVEEDFDAIASGIYLINTSGQVITCTLPATPAIGTIIRFIDAYGKFQTNAFRINPNGNRIQGQTLPQIQYTENFTFVDFFYASPITGWIAK